MKTIIQNEAECRKCGEIIWSAHRHDFKSCSCGAISVDGGMAYIRRCGNPEDIIERRILKTSELKGKRIVIGFGEKMSGVVPRDFVTDLRNLILPGGLKPE